VAHAAARALPERWHRSVSELLLVSARARPQDQPSPPDGLIYLAPLRATFTKVDDGITASDCPLQLGTLQVRARQPHLKGWTALFRRQVPLTLNNPDDYFSWHARCRFVEKANKSSIADNKLEVASWRCGWCHRSSRKGADSPFWMGHEQEENRVVKPMACEWNHGSCARRPPVKSWTKAPERAG